MKRFLKLKKLISNNKELLLGIIVGLMLSSTAVFAVIKYSSDIVFYRNTSSHLNATTVQAAIDELYTTCTSRAYTLTADSKGGTIPTTAGWSITGSTATKPVIFNSEYGTLPTPTKSGYTFVGWFTKESGGTEITSSTKYRITGDSTIHAHWNTNSYTIGYAMNGGNNPSPKPTSGTTDSVVSIGTTSAPTKTVTVTGDENGTGATIGEATSAAQTFAGWSSSSSAGLGSNAKTGTSDNPTTAWNGSATTNKYFKNLRDTSGTVTLTANWTPVAFNLPTISKEGWTCKWNTKADGTGTDYNSGASYTPTANSNQDITMYAKCTGNTYTGTFYYQSNTNSDSTTVSSKTASCTVTSGNSCSATIPTEVTGSGGTYNNKYVGLSTSTGNMTQAVAGSATTVSLTATRNYYSLYRTEINIAYPTSTTAATTKTTYQNQWFTSNTAMATTVLSTTTTGTNSNATAGALVSGYSLVGFNASASNNTGTWTTLDGLTKSNSSKAASRTVYQIEKSTATKTATFYYNNNTNCGGTTVASATATGSQTTFLRCTSTTAAGTSISNGAITVPTAVTGSKGPYNASYINVASAVNSMAAATVNTGTLTYYAFYRSNVTRVYPSSTTASTSDTLYRNEVFTSTTEMKTVLATTNTGTSTNAAAKLAVSGYGTLVGFNTAASQNSANSGATIAALATTCNTKVYEIDKKTETKTATFYYQSSTSNKTTTIDSTTATGTQTTFLRPTTDTTAGTIISNGSITIPTAVTGSGGTYNNKYVGVAAATGTMTSQTTANTGTLTYYSVYRTTINIYYPTSTTVATSKATYQNQWFTSTTAMATTVLSTSSTGTTANATAGALVSGYGTLVGFNTAASTNTQNKGANIDALTQSDSGRAATVNVYQIAKTTATKTATFYYNNNTTCGGTTVASTTATGTQTTFLRCTSTTAAGTSVSNGAITVPSAVSGSKGSYNATYINVASAVNSMAAATVNTGTLTYYAFYRSNVTRVYPSSTTASTSDTLYRNEVFTSTTAMKTVLATTNTGVTTNAAAKLAVSGYGTLVGFNTAASQNSANSGATIDDLRKTCNTKVYEIDKGTASKTARFYYQSSATNETCSVTSTTASGTQTTFLRPTADTTAGTSVSNGAITVPTAVTGSVGQYNNAYAGVASAVNSMTAATVNTGTLTYYAFYRSSVNVYRPSSESAATTQPYYRNMALSSTTACGASYLSTSTTGLSNTTPTMVSGYSFSSLHSEANLGGTAYSVANAAKTNLTSFYLVEAKSVTATYYYNNNTTCAGKTIASTTASGSRTLYSTSTTAATVSNGAITVPSAVSGSKGPYNSAYIGVASGTSSMSTATSNTANTTYYAIYRTNVTNYYYSSSYTNRTVYRNEFFTSTTAISTVMSTSSTGTSNYSTAVGPGNSVWSGLSTGADTTAEYATVAASATSSTCVTSLYTVYQFNVTYAKGANVSSIGATSGSCKVSSTGASAGGTSCNVTLPSITANTGATAVGWSTTNGATSGTAAGSSYSITANPKTLYGNAKLNTYSVTYNAGGTCTGATGLPSAQTKTYGVSLTLSSTSPTCTGKVFLGWSTTSSANASSIWYDGGTTYTTNSGLTLYAQFYDVNSLEQVYTTFAQNGDFKKSDIVNSSDDPDFTDSSLYHPFAFTPNCGSNYTRRVEIASFYTSYFYFRPYQIALNKMRLRLVTSSDPDSTWWAEPTTSSVCSYNRSAATYSDGVNARIQRLQQIEDVALKYSDFKTISSTKDNITIGSSRYAEGVSIGQEDNYKILSRAAGYDILNASSSGTGISRVYEYMSSTSEETSVPKTLLCKSQSGLDAKVKHTQYIIEVINNKSASRTFPPSGSDPVGKKRYSALATLNTNKSNYFPASHLKTKLVEGSSASPGAWSSNTCQIPVTLTNGRLLGVSSHGVECGSNGTNCSFAVMNRFFVSGANTTSGTLTMKYYAGNKYTTSSTAYAMTNVNSYAYVVYLSSGDLSIGTKNCS